jgi:3-keto-5-aminohexanoate cleavage enzyme
MVNQKYFVLSLAPTGIIPNKNNTPHAVMFPDQLAAELDRMPTELTAIHLHARDAAGQHTGDPARYAEYIAVARQKLPDVVVCTSCSGRLDPSFEPRSAVLDLDGDLKPDMGSLTLSSLNFASGPSVNAPDTIVRLVTRMTERGIKPELEVFDLGMMNFAHYLIRKGYIEPPYYFNFILGNIAGAQTDPLHLGSLIRELPAQSVWNVGGIGSQQTQAVAASLAFGGGVRTGLEDNLWLDADRTIAATNAGLVEKVVSIGAELGRAPMAGAMLRELLGLPSRS